MAELRWTEEAYQWLRDIYNYIATDNPTAAQRVVSGIYEKAQILRRFPEIGHKYRDEEDGENQIRSASIIDILGVFHGALDIDRYLP
ncbi:MAG: type II toxin-antitoxin system RelE/ParE family toxin [Deltaproteobacteria bacterium]|nr:type II toxin-antitoxin system RelE/ParE family toxin [Deltaproteobacteria bacterium]